MAPKMSTYQLFHLDNYSKIAFDAMASPCEILIRNLDPVFCHQVAEIAVTETKRIESKFSRYIQNNLLFRMNNSNSRAIKIDSETFKLLEYARNLFELSDGLFDITSGILRKIWHFNTDSKPPSKTEVHAILNHIGFDLINYNKDSFSMPKGMQIDFGGIGKEYAVDQVTQLILSLCKSQSSSFLVNFGGDLSAAKLQKNDPIWTVGLESAENTEKTQSVINIARGCVATSGNTKRYLDYQGKRYGHLLNPKTGYPVDAAPRSITAFSNNCVLAGSFSSLAMLQGAEAEHFLKEQAIDYICIW